MATPTSPVNTWLLLNDRPLLFRADYDNREILANELHNVIKTTPDAPGDLEISVCEYANAEKQGILIEIDDSPASREWGWKPEGKAGLYELHVKLPGHPIYSALIYAHPGPISKRHEVIMMDNLRTMQDFLFLLGSWNDKKATSQLLNGDISPLRTYEQVKYILANLKPVIEEISHRPHSVLQHQHQTLHIHEIRTFSNKVIPQWNNVLPRSTSLAPTCPLEYLPAIWIMTRTMARYDTYENRLLRQFLQGQLLPKLSFIREQAWNEIHHRKRVLEQVKQEIQRRVGERDEKDVSKLKRWKIDENRMLANLHRVVAECQQMMQECNRWLNQNFLLSVESMSVPLQATQVLLKNPLYHRFYRLYLEFQQTLALNLNTEHFLSKLSLRPLSGIYQVWAIFSLTRKIVTRLLQDEYEPLGSHKLFYEVKKNYFHFDLRGNVTTIILTKGKTRIEIKYEPQYPYYKDIGNSSGIVARSSRLGLTPDMAVEVYKGDQLIYFVIFDAKDRSHQVGNSKQYLPDDEDSLDKYFNGIVYKQSNLSDQKLRDIPTIACIVYSGTVLDWVPGDPPAVDIRGALPLIPNMLPGITDEVNKTIDDILSIVHLT